MSNYSKLHSSYTCHKLLSTMHCFTWIFVENCSILNFSIQRSKRLGSSITDFNFGRPVRKNTTSLLHQCITKSAWSRFLRCVHKLMDDPFVNCLTSPRACSYSGRRYRRAPWRLLRPQAFAVTTSPAALNTPVTRLHVKCHFISTSSGAGRAHKPPISRH